MRSPNGNRRRSAPVLSPRAVQENNLRNARINLLVVVLISAINILMVFLDDGRFYIFSAYLPYFLTALGALLTGRLSDEWYPEGRGDMLPNAFLIAMIALSVIIVAVYFVCWLLSKKHSAWYIVTLALFAVDTLIMIFLEGFYLESIVAIAFHAWVIYYMVMAINASSKLKNMPIEGVGSAADVNDGSSSDGIYGEAPFSGDAFDGTSGDGTEEK